MHCLNYTKINKTQRRYIKTSTLPDCSWSDLGTEVWIQADLDVSLLCLPFNKTCLFIKPALPRTNWTSFMNY